MGEKIRENAVLTSLLVDLRDEIVAKEPHSVADTLVSRSLLTDADYSAILEIKETKVAQARFIVNCLRNKVKSKPSAIMDVIKAFKSIGLDTLSESIEKELSAHSEITEIRNDESKSKGKQSEKIETRNDESNSKEYFHEVYKFIKEEHDSSLAKLLTNQQYDLSTKIGEREETLLHVVCRNGNLDVLRTLIEVFGCRLDVPDIYGDTPCHAACRYGQVEIMNYLYNCHFSWSCPLKNDQGETWLHLATRSGNIQLMRLITYNYIAVEKKWSKLVEFNDDILYQYFSKNKLVKLPNSFHKVFVPDKKGYTPVHIACINRNLLLLDFFLKELDLVLNFNFTQYIPSLLMLAYEMRSEDVIKYLLPYRNMTLLPCPHMDESLRIINFTHSGIPFSNETAPFFLARRGDLELLKVLCRSLDSLDITNDLGDTLLHAACVSCDLDTVTEIFDDFILNKVDPYIKNAAGNTCLHVACEWGSYNIAKFLINGSKALINAMNTLKETPLHIAIRHKRKKIVQLLVDSKADLTIKNDHGESMLHVSTCDPQGFHYIKSCSDLLSADILNSNDANGDSPLFNAFRTKNKEMVKYLIDQPHCNVCVTNGNTNETVASIACRFQWKDILSSLLSKKVHPVKLQNYLGQTLAHIACWIRSGENEILNFLANSPKAYDISEDINLLDVLHERTPLQMACVKSDFKLFGYLLDLIGCFPDTKNRKGNTVLHICCLHNLIKMAERCQSHCSVTVRNEEGNTPLHLALKEQNFEILLMLLKGIPADQRIDSFINKEGRNVLHVAAIQEGTINIIKHMIEFNHCDPTYTGKNKNTALHFAFQNGVFDNAQYLLTVGYKKELWYNKDHQSPLSLALDNHKYDFIEKIVYFCIEDMLLSCCDISSSRIPYCFSPTIQSVKMPLLLYLFRLLVRSKPAEPSGDAKQPSDQILSLIFKLVKAQDIPVDITKLKDSYDNTILHYMSMCKYSETLNNIYDFLYKEFDLNCLNKGSSTPLHYACLSPQDWMLMKLFEDNEHAAFESLNKESFSGKPLELSHHSDGGRLFLAAQGSVTNDIMISSYCKDTGFSLAIGIIVLGNSGVGKTTLIETLRAMITGDRNIKEIDKPTTGLVTNDYVHKINGHRYTFHDFAGQVEFETSHSVLLENLLELAADDRNSFAFLLLVKGTDSLEQNEEQIDRWLSFVRGHVQINTSSVHVILVCSHDDKFSSIAEQEQRRKDLTAYLKSCDAKPINKHGHPIFLDGKKADTSPTYQLMACIEDIFISWEPVNTCHVTNELNFFIQKWFSDSPCQVKDLIKTIIQNRNFTLDPNSYLIKATGEYRHMIIPQRLDSIVEYLDKLFSRYEIILLKPSVTNKSDWWIVGKKVQRDLFSKANSLFSPSNFSDCPNHSLQTFNTGVVPFSKLNEIFSKSDVTIDLIINYMISLEFCKEISDKTATIIGYKGNQGEKLYFFPGLIDKEKDSDIYEDQMEDHFVSAFLIENKHKWGLRFLHNLLLHLTYKFATIQDGHHYTRRIHLWKNGLFITTDKQIELLVELKEDKYLNLVCRGSISSHIELAELRCNVFEVIRNIEQNMKDRGSNEFDSTTYVLYKPPSTYSAIEKADKIPLLELKKCFRDKVNYRAHYISKTKSVKLKEILRSEPYVFVELSLIKSYQDENYTLYATELEPLLSQIPELKEKNELSAPQFHQIIQRYSIFSVEELALER